MCIRDRWGGDQIAAPRNPGVEHARVETAESLDGNIDSVLIHILGTDIAGDDRDPINPMCPIESIGVEVDRDDSETA